MEDGASKVSVNNPTECPIIEGYVTCIRSQPQIHRTRPYYLNNSARLIVDRRYR